MRLVFCCLIFVAGTSTAANAQQSTLDCAVLAATNYNKAKLVLSGNALQFSVETEIAERRLEEQYCLERAKCEVQTTDATQPWYQMALGTAFSECLDDEAEEKLKHASPRPKRKK